MSEGRRRSPEAARRAAANAAEYRALRSAFDPGSPKASGYLSEWSFRRERELVLGALGPAPGVLLDIGCGGGAMTGPLVGDGGANGRSPAGPALRSLPSAVVGLELGAGACEAAARAGLLAVRGDAFEMPFGDQVADAAVSIEMAQEHESAEVARLFGEAARVLRPGGRLVVVWGNRAAWVHRAAHRLLSLVGRLRLSSDSFPAPYHHAPAAMRAAAEGAGFALDEWWALFPPWRLRFRGVGGPGVRLLGSSFLAVFRKPPSGNGTPSGNERPGSAEPDSAEAGRAPSRTPAGKDAPPAGKGAPAAGKDAPPAGKDAPPAGKDLPTAGGRGR